MGTLEPIEAESQSPVRWTPVLPIIEEFQSGLAANSPRIGLLAGADRAWPEQRYHEEDRKSLLAQRGVYLIFDSGGTLQYVGFAASIFRDCIWGQDRYMNRDWIDLIPFPAETLHFAPALERLLVSRLRPPMNWRHREIPGNRGLR